MSKRWTIAALAMLAIGCTQNHKNHEGKEEEEGNEVKMSINDVPAPVRATLQREAQGATITTVDKEESHGKTIYETDVTLNGKNWEIKVDPTGKLIGKKLDEESKEKGEKDEKEEKEEHGKH